MSRCSATGRSSGTPQSPAPRYVVLCAFHRFEIWEPGAVYTERRASHFDPDGDSRARSTRCCFSPGDEPVFVGDAGRGHPGGRRARDGGSTGARVSAKAAEPDVAATISCCRRCGAMFAEDLGAMPAVASLYARRSTSCSRIPAVRAADELGQLFAYLNEPNAIGRTEGLYAANAIRKRLAVCDNAARVHLDR